MKLPSTRIFNTEYSLATNHNAGVAPSWPPRPNWSCIRCAVKWPACQVVCANDPTGAVCVACLGSQWNDCKKCGKL